MTSSKMWDSAHFQLYQAKTTNKIGHYIIYKGEIACLDPGMGSTGIHGGQKAKNLGNSCRLVYVFTRKVSIKC